MSLRQKLIETFDVYIPEATSDKALLAELDRRGKINNKSLLTVLLMVVEVLDDKPKK